MKKDHDKIHTYNPPERFEQHWDEHLKPGIFRSWRGAVPWIVSAVIFWVIIAWILVARYW